jgi:hypothetical protein
MRASLVLLLIFINTAPSFAWQLTPPDTIPGKKDLVPFNIKLPAKDSAKTASKNLLAFPFAVRSLETDWGFGGIVARFFKAGRVGMVGFASMGEVAPTAGRFELDGFHYAYGGGVRVMLSKEEKLNLRVDYGVGKRSNAFTVQLREAF